MLWLADKTRVREELVVIPGEPSIKDLIEAISINKPEEARRILRGILSGNSEVIVLVNSKTPPQGLDTKLKDGDVVSFMPPVSGG